MLYYMTDGTRYAMIARLRGEISDAVRKGDTFYNAFNRTGNPVYEMLAKKFLNLADDCDQSYRELIWDVQ